MSKQATALAGKVIHLPTAEIDADIYGPDFPSIIRGILMLPSHTPGAPAITHYAQCRYCGQSRVLEHGFADQAKAEEYVILHCNCTGAELHKDALRRKLEREQDLARAAECIDSMFGSGASDYGMEPVEDDQIAYMCEGAVAVYDDTLKDITINIGDGVKVKIAKTSKGNITISRNDSATYKQEV